MAQLVPTKRPGQRGRRHGLLAALFLLILVLVLAALVLLIAVIVLLLQI